MLRGNQYGKLSTLQPQKDSGANMSSAEEFYNLAKNFFQSYLPQTTESTASPQRQWNDVLRGNIPTNYNHHPVDLACTGQHQLPQVLRPMPLMDQRPTTHTQTASSLNPHYPAIVKQLDLKVRTAHHLKNWERVPPKIASQFHIIFDSIAPPNPTAEFKKKLTVLRLNLLDSLSQLVRSHIQECQEKIEETLPTLDETDGDKAAFLVQDQLQVRNKRIPRQFAFTHLNAGLLSLKKVRNTATRHTAPSPQRNTMESESDPEASSTTTRQQQDIAPVPSPVPPPCDSPPAASGRYPARTASPHRSRSRSRSPLTPRRRKTTLRSLGCTVPESSDSEYLGRHTDVGKNRNDLQKKSTSAKPPPPKTKWRAG